MNATEIRTRVEITRRIDRTTDKAASRYCTGCAEVRSKPNSGNVYVTTTTCKTLAINQFEGSTENTELIPPTVIPKTKTGATVELNGQWENNRGKFASYDPDYWGKFPNCGSVVEDVLDTVSNPNYSMCLNAKMLAELAESLGSDEVRLVFKMDKDEPAVANAIAVQPANVDESRSFGVIMPMWNGDTRNEHIKQLASDMQSYVSTCNSDTDTKEVK